VREGRFLALDPTKAQDLISALRNRVDGLSQQHLTLVVSDAPIRRYVRRLTEIEFPRIPVLAERELTGNFSHIGAPVIYPAPTPGG
jgi:type III secretory pathway component EscV